jgi:hypothetical protein
MPVCVAIQQLLHIYCLEEESLGNGRSGRDGYGRDTRDGGELQGVGILIVREAEGSLDRSVGSSEGGEVVVHGVGESSSACGVITRDVKDHIAINEGKSLILADLRNGVTAWENHANAKVSLVSLLHNNVDGNTEGAELLVEGVGGILGTGDSISGTHSGNLGSEN